MSKENEDVEPFEQKEEDGGTLLLTRSTDHSAWTPCLVAVAEGEAITTESCP